MSQKKVIEIKTELKKQAKPEKVELLKRFFRTGRGEYAEGDQMIAVSVPNQRKIAKKYLDSDLDVLGELLKSKIHEHRLTALIILVYQYQKEHDRVKKKIIYKFYLKNRKYVNNWDLVDLSAHYIVGDYLIFEKDRKILYQLASSKILWDRRIAMISCFAFIRKNDFWDALKIAKILIEDKHDLIHKVVGWMLREIGKRNKALELQFIDKNLFELPRTTLRYALEKFPREIQIEYLTKKRPAN